LLLQEKMRKNFCASNWYVHINASVYFSIKNWAFWFYVGNSLVPLLSVYSLFLHESLPYCLETFFNHVLFQVYLQYSYNEFFHDSCFNSNRFCQTASLIKILSPNPYLCFCRKWNNFYMKFQLMFSYKFWTYEPILSELSPFIQCSVNMFLIAFLVFSKNQFRE
jgi:hypothetical protein